MRLLHRLMDEVKEPGATGGTPAPAAVPAAAPAAAPATVADPPVEQKGYWPEDWLSKISKGDEKLSKQFGQYASPEALAEAHVALRKRMDSGNFITKLAPDAKPEEVTQWRKTMGLPEAPDKYDLTGVEIRPEEKPIIDSFLKAAHAANMTPEQVRAAVQWRQADTKALSDLRNEEDEKQKREALDSLSAEYGKDWPANRNRVENFLNLLPEKAREALIGGRTATGRAFFNDPELLRGFIAIERMMNPAGVVVPSAGGDMVKGVVDEYQAIQKTMREKRAEYNKDENMQARFRVLAEHLTKDGRLDAVGNVIVQDGRKAA